jgi:sugar O-acyltransferase (sialic acid O-acetyltransferase NeuD family)
MLLDMFKTKVIVIGSGGFSSEIIDYISVIPSIQIIGVADDYIRDVPPKNVKGFPFLGKLKDVLSGNDDVQFVVASGRPSFREETCEFVLNAGRKLFTLVHPTAIVAPDAQIGLGCILAPYTIVNSGARLEIGCVLNVFSSVGHGASIGSFTVLSPYAAVNGWGLVGRSCFLGSRATIFPRIRIGDRCIVDSHSFVKANVDDRMIISVRGVYSVLKNRLEKK